MLVLLDLSAAFDTVDHGILLSRLSQCFGVQGSAYTLVGVLPVQSFTVRPNQRY